MPAHSGDQEDVSSLPVNKDVCASLGLIKIYEVVIVAAMVLLSDAVEWTVADCESKYADCFDIFLFNAMFSNGRNAIMYDRSGVKRDTEIREWNSYWDLI